MRYRIIKFSGLLLLVFLLQKGFCQEYPFTKNFVPGIIEFNDSTSEQGLIKWFPDPSEKLKFRKTEKSEMIKYAPEQLQGFSCDTLKFKSLANLLVYAGDYSLLGKMTKIKKCFAQLLDSGNFNIYLIQLYAYNAVISSSQLYPNFVFEIKSDSGSRYAAFPINLRMKEKKYDRAKDDLMIFFREYPGIAEKIKLCRQQDDFLEVVDFMKKSN